MASLRCFSCDAFQFLYSANFYYGFGKFKHAFSDVSYACELHERAKTKIAWPEFYISAPKSIIFLLYHTFNNILWYQNFFGEKIFKILRSETAGVEQRKKLGKEYFVVLAPE